MGVDCCEVRGAGLTGWDRFPPTASPDMRAMAVLSSGSSAGRTDPKNRSRMIRAATTPIRVLDDEAGLVDAAIAPTTSTCRVGEFGARARRTSWVASAAGLLLASFVKLT